MSCREPLVASAPSVKTRSLTIGVPVHRSFAVQFGDRRKGGTACSTTFSARDDVAQQLYDHATESAPGSVDADIGQRLARKLGAPPAPRFWSTIPAVRRAL